MIHLKEKVALKASTYVEDGMIVGLGTGSTAYYLIEELGRRVKEEGLNIIGVPTSKRSYEQAEALGIPLKQVHEVPYIDITIDGADEFDDALNGIKGGGAALLFEKVVAERSKMNLWIVDESKHVQTLGRFPLAVEVVPFAADVLYQAFVDKGYHPTWRMDGTKRFLTDSCNNILDLHLEAIKHPLVLASELDHTTGVVEHGLFLGIADTVLVGTDHEIKIYSRLNLR